jgi:RNA polymerase sigma factor (sigma-70 family)
MSASSRARRDFVATVEHKYGRALRRFLSMRLRHASADVADIFQEIFLRLLRVKDHESIRNPQAYLYTVASHVLYQYTLGKSAVPDTGEPLELLAQLQAETFPDPAIEVDLQQRITDVARALEKLSPRAYATLVMYRCEGMTLEEIGERLGVSRPMARKYLTRALAFCDQYFEDSGGV